MYILYLREIVWNPGVKGIVCIKGIVKFLHTKTQLMIFSEMLIEKKTLEYMSMFFGKQRDWLYPAIPRVYFHFENSLLQS